MQNSLNPNTHSHAGKIETAIIAERLLLSNGRTTTLEVKLELRRQGYIAYQSDISFFMDQLAAELDWPYTSNGRNRVYVQAFVDPEWWDQLVTVCTN